MQTTLVYRNSGGVKRTMVHDEDRPHALSTYTEVEMDAVLEGIKREREMVVEKSTNKLLARVPMTIVEKSIHEQWDEADWKKWLNDPDNAAFRVWQGRV